ncbi:Nitrogenase molybdenum-iron protein, alpha and beta chains [Anaerocolumna jejuensis DSM 15929]|uniref:Nitrogenase molybdenum-iron protein, alpha and beta chains n=1 Tax=Anaerocolumna jejuensis DSM 15929 TaxID=1121322 RepID=A0A1M6UBD5_9FIRM|nr:nitrogenase component 1 [Anaerocolumna jejuensis]SHK66487.1 Nitrogenase molybdenum-iron protein, alpha and beta chains [Anaerocolumna jejuensis DSM 15929]
MGLYKYHPVPSGRMGALWTLATIKGAVVLEFGSMGHMIYAKRWLEQAGYSKDCQAFVTHLDEKDIALGMTDRIEAALDGILEKQKAEAVFLIPSSVPEVIGIDMEAICQELSFRYEGLPILYFPCGGFDRDYHRGIETALYELCRNLPEKTLRTEELTCNIIGSGIDLHLFEADAREIERMLWGAFGMKVSCVLSTRADMEGIRRLGEADINLVLRREGIRAGETLKEQFGTPYLYGRPYGIQGTVKWLEQVGKLSGRLVNTEFIVDEIKDCSTVYDSLKHILEFFGERLVFSAGGSRDVVQGLKEFAVEELGIREGLFWCEAKEDEKEGISCLTEEKVLKELGHLPQGILMARKEYLKTAGRNTGLLTDRGINEWNFNPYVPPYVGFRGVTNLCSLWFQEIE